MDHWPGGKPPRAYAAEIVEIKTKEGRRAALDAVPEQLREWVRGYVETAFARRSAARG